jgi:hypothetical protein
MNKMAIGMVTVAAALALNGCVNQGVPKSYPGQGQPIVVKVSSEGLSSFSEMPMGTYRIPNSQVLISGRQQGNALAIGLGVSGAISRAADSSAGKAAVQSLEDSLRLSLSSEAQHDLVGLAQTEPFSNKFTLLPNPNAPVLSITGDIVLQFVNDTDVRPYVVLKSQLQGAQSAIPVSTMRYVASVGLPRPLTGKGGWTADDGAPLKSVISKALERALTVMLTDVSSPFPRDEDRQIAVKGNYVFLTARLQVVGYFLTEDTDWIAFSPRMPSTSLLSGVSIMDKSVTTYRPATKSDPRIKAADPH